MTSSESSHTILVHIWSECVPVERPALPDLLLERQHVLSVNPDIIIIIIIPLSVDVLSATVDLHACTNPACLTIA